MKKKTDFMTIDELLHKSLINFALDNKNDDMLLQLSKNQYEVIKFPIKEVEEVDKKD